ncbi:MAG: hypothetical protein KAG53_00465 [Endozoicomonadaceae bacterium]|nr:hypothetical protein [Endozoicomonadaceae bacterium]
MNSCQSFHLNVNSTNNILLSSADADDMPDKTFGLHSISLAETAQEEANSLASKESRFSTENNEIHGNQDNKNVNFKPDETFLESLENQESLGNNRNSADNDNANQTKHKRENIAATSIKRVVGELTNFVVGFFKTAFMPMYENGLDGFGWNPTLENTILTLGTIFSPLLTHIYLLKKTGAFGIILNSFSTVGAKSVDNVIDIDNIRILKQIGWSAKYRYDGHYRLTANIDASNLRDSIPEFIGTLDGQGHIISHLQCCLVVKLSDNALIKDIIISDADTGLLSCTATIAGTVSNYAIISNIQVLGSQIKSQMRSSYAGIIANAVNNFARVEHSLVLHSSMIATKSYTNIGGVAGMMGHSAESLNNTIRLCNITIYGNFSSAGGVTGLAQSNIVINQSSIDQVNIASHGLKAAIALLAGLVNHILEINNTTLTNSTAQAFGSASNTGFAAGLLHLFEPTIKISNTLSICCHSIATADSIESLWVGGMYTVAMTNKNQIQLSNSRVINCTSANADQRLVTQFTTTEPVTQLTTTEPITQLTTTEPVTQLTTTEPITQFNMTQSTIAEPVAVEDLSLVPILLYGFYGGCAFAGVATAALVSYSIYSGHKQGKRGWELVKHLEQSCLEWFTNLCQSPSRPVQSEGIEATGATETEMIPLSSEMPIQRSDHTVVLETDKFL